MCEETHGQMALNRSGQGLNGGSGACITCLQQAGKISKKHLWRYIAEFVAKQNVRAKNTIDQMKLIVQKFEGKRLKYKNLVAS